jgi:polyisoprenyl-phosphate glycosyltransferase
MTAVLFIGSIQLLATGVLGLYIHSIYMEVKGRPNYIIESLYGFDNEFSAEEEMDLREILKKLQKIKLP